MEHEGRTAILTIDLLSMIEMSLLLEHIRLPRSAGILTIHNIAILCRLCVHRDHGYSIKLIWIVIYIVLPDGPHDRQ